MKKQILLLTFFTMAILFAGMNSYGQYQTVPTIAPGCIAPTPFTDPTLCLTDALHPVQGTTYDYTVEVTSATDVVRWFVVDNTAMEAAGDSLVSVLSGVLAAGNGAIDNGLGTDPYIFSVEGGTYENGGAAAGAGLTSTLQLQWKFFDGISNEILVVAYVETDPDCTDNIAVYRIIPKPAFTVDIASVLEDGSSPQYPAALGGTVNEECVSPVEKAWYDGSASTPDQLLTVDYGENWVFFVVNGANYFDSWMPTFQIDYAGGTAPPTAEASWAYLGDATDATATNWNDLTGTINGGDWTSAVPVIAGASAGSPGTVGAGVLPAVGGECIVVRVRLDWGTDIEHDQANGTLTLRADGTSYDGDGADFFDNSTASGGAGSGDFNDKHYVDCLEDGFTNDWVDYNITPRPQVEDATVDPAVILEQKTGDTVN